MGGETLEVLSVAKFARRNGIPIIAVSGRSESSLARLADIFLDISVEKEACPLNLAPTTSSTLTLALGDSLAVALMELKGFTKEEFAKLHPGGSLGVKLSMVSDLMKGIEHIGILRVDDDFHKILEMVTLKNYGIAAVLDENDFLIGCITDGDVRRSVLQLETKVFQQSAKGLMSSKPKVIDAAALAVDAVRIMEENKVTALFVLKNNRLTGIVRLHDLLVAKIV